MTKKVVLSIVIAVVIVLAIGAAVVFLYGIKCGVSCVSPFGWQTTIEEEAVVELPEVRDGSLENRNAWKQHIKWSDKCETDFVDNNLPAGLKYLEFYSLSEKESLVQVMCYLGPYQGVYEFVYFNEYTRETKQLLLTNYYKDNGVERKEVEQNVCGTPYYVDDVLTSFCKGRSMGDCGHVFSYRFNDVRKELETVEVRVEEKCEGNYDRSSWEVIYPK
mgnify:CR=1 FL=1